jgi:hypothetical protein
MKKLICLSITAVLLFAAVAPVMARTPEEIMQIRTYLSDQIDILHATDKMSNDEVYSVWVDLNQISSGNVSATVYSTAYETVAVSNFNNIKIQPIQGNNGAHDKLVRFFFYLDNNDEENFLAQWGSAPENTVLGYVYGTTKTQTLNAFVAGIPECLERQRVYDNPSGGGGGSSTKTETPDPDSWAEKYLTTTFTLDANTYSVASITNSTETETVQPDIKSMDVAPYIKDSRTYVPVRYLAYSLGVPQDGVTWDNDTQKVGINKGDTSVTLTINNPVMLVNQESVAMDVAPEITSDRTFLPARWVAEALGATVEWDDTQKQAIIKMPIEEKLGE